ncbi:MAG: hypothetical protein WDO18_10550 [Acidobacteriota bacterium]
MVAGRLQIAGYVGVVAACFALGMLAGWNGFGLARRIDNQTYDLFSRPTPGVAQEGGCRRHR